MGQDSHTLEILRPHEVGISNMPVEPLAGAGLSQVQAENFNLWSNDRGKAMLTSRLKSKVQGFQSEVGRCRA